MENLLGEFLNSGKVNTAIEVLRTCYLNKSFRTGIEFGKFFMGIFPDSVDIHLLTINCLYEAKEYTECFDILEMMKDRNLNEASINEICKNQSLCIPHISDRYIDYNSDLIQKITNRNRNPFPIVTFTITTCKRYDLFEKTMNSFINCCQDILRIDHWLCIDDNSSEEDRHKMKEKYPFFEFYFKNISEKGHPRSMNIIKNRVKTPYIFHMEDDWKFVCKKDYIRKCIEVLSYSENIGQCLINKNYIEVAEQPVIGGKFLRTVSGSTFLIHEYCGNETEYEDFYKRHGKGANCAYWKHFSFRPSLIRKSVFNELGSFDEKVSHFEQDYSERYIKAGLVSAFLNGLYCLHTGRLTSERFDNGKANAYILNNEKQFEAKNEVKNDSKNLDYKPPSDIKSYIINLDRRSDRWQKLLVYQEPKFLNYERFSAVDGSKLKPNKQLQRIFEGNDYNMKQGAVGCAMSHIKLWIDLLKSHKNAFCIFEDDISFVPGFQEKFLHVYNNLPKDCDFCYLGHHMWKHFRSPEFYDKNMLPILEKWGAEKSLGMSMGGFIGYIITKKGAEIILNIINQMGMMNCIDTIQQKAANVMNTYYCKPLLVYSECYTPENKVDTDITCDNKSLDLGCIVSREEYPERLKKNGKYDIEEALVRE